MGQAWCSVPSAPWGLTFCLYVVCWGAVLPQNAGDRCVREKLGLPEDTGRGTLDTEVLQKCLWVMQACPPKEEAAPPASRRVLWLLLCA